MYIFNVMLNKKNMLIVFLCFAVALTWMSTVYADSAKQKYFKAEACYKQLRHSPKKQKYRENWLACIKKFKMVYKHAPSGPWAPAGLYMSGKLYSELYQRSYKKSDKKEAIDSFERIIKRFPKSGYKVKARQALANFSKKKQRPRSVVKKKPVKQLHKASSNTRASQSKFKKKSPPYLGYRTISGLRFWSNPSYTRIVIDADKEISYVHNLLKRDPSINKPQRLYIDLDRSRLDKTTKKTIPINDNLLMDVRAAQYKKDAVRVVVEIKSFKTYNIFSLRNPFRIVIDVWGKELQKNTASFIVKNNTKLSGNAIAKQFALGVKRIVIDPGHGGRDYGAPGYYKGVHEKTVVLQIAKKLKKKITQQLGCDVILTRSTDKYLTLEERTAIANTSNADLFISIHTNAARNKKAYGFETYFLNLATDNSAILVAARENATSAKNISDLQTILTDLMQNAKINESSRLADYIQKSIFFNMKKKYSKIKNKGVKQAPFYVLLGAQMPAILIEASFISNPRECKRLTNRNYQERLCAAIVGGVETYIREINPTALLKNKKKKKAS